MIPPVRLQIIIYIIFLGALVLGSYVWGIFTIGDNNDLFWGRMPASIQAFYPPSMILAAIGFFIFSYFILFSLSNENLASQKFYGIFSFNLCYLLILIPSILWMPLTVSIIQETDPLLWVIIRLVLFLVALGSVLLTFNLWTSMQRSKSLLSRLAFLGSIIFSFHTLILDAIIWPYYFN